MTDLGSGGCWVESVGPEGVQKVVSALDDRPGQWWVLGGECWTRRCTEGVVKDKRTKFLSQPVLPTQTYLQSYQPYTNQYNTPVLPLIFESFNDLTVPI